MSPKGQTARTGKVPFFSTPSSLEFMGGNADIGGPSSIWPQAVFTRHGKKSPSVKGSSKSLAQNRKMVGNPVRPGQSSPAAVADKHAMLLNNKYSKATSPVGTLAKEANIRHFQRSARPASVSTCGDLEGPCRLTPRISHYPSSREIHERIHEGDKSFSPVEIGDGHRYRSRSRTSNISRKRNGVKRIRPGPDPERKKMLMHQVAQYWNECIGISEEERVQARVEIDQLREDLQDQQGKVAEAQQRLEKELAERQALEGKLRCIEENALHSSVENSKLTSEITALRDQLRSSKDRSTALNEKSRAYRSKLNEAILEQQRLFAQAREFYNESIRQLHMENEARTAESKTVEKALTESRHKIQRMKKCIEELHSGLGQEVKLKNQEIAQLQEKVLSKDQDIAAERQISLELRSQLSANELFRSKAVQELTEKLESISKSLDNRDLTKCQAHQMSSQIEKRFENIEHLLKDYASSLSPNKEVGFMMRDLQEMIRTDICSMLVELSGGQRIAGEFLKDIGHKCQSELGFIRGAINNIAQKQTFGHDQDVQGRLESSEKLQSIQGDVHTTQEVCRQIGKDIKTWLAQERLSINRERNCWKDVVLHLVEENGGSDELKSLFHEVNRSYLSKLDELSRVISTKDNAVGMMQLLSDEFRGILDTELLQGREKAAQDLGQTQRALFNLECQINAMSKQLQSVEAKSLPQDKEIIPHLQKRICVLEKEAEDITALRDRWYGDIKMVDSMRSQLKNLEMLVPQIHQCNQQVEESSGARNLLDETSSYLAQEKEWVTERLGQELRLDAETGISKTELPVRAIVTAVGQSDNAFDRGNNQVDSSRMIHASKNPNTIAGHILQSEGNIKRVQVHSPAGNPSPSSPPTIQQEKRQRRDAGSVRPILKSANLLSSQAPLSRLQLCDEIETELGPVQESRKGVSVASNTSEASRRIIHEISSGFMISSSDDNFISLPTLADFQSDHKASTMQRNFQKRDHQNQHDFEKLKAKKVKVAGAFTSQGKVGFPAAKFSRQVR